MTKTHAILIHILSLRKGESMYAAVFLRGVALNAKCEINFQFGLLVPPYFFLP